MDEITSWHSYPSIYAFGHPALAELLNDPITIEEKIDGSQFSFGRFGEELRCRSKGVQMYLDAPEAMFSLAVDYIKSIKPLLKDGWTYRAEYLRKPKHNTLHYDRVPKNNLIIFDINSAQETYLSYEEKVKEAALLDLEVVPLMFNGMLTDPNFLREQLIKKSCLGNVEIEGVVVKNYLKFGRDKKVLMGKFVSERFKEVHKSEWKLGNPGKADIIQALVAKYQSPARWLKAVQHLRDSGQLEMSPRDIPKLMIETKTDLNKECREEIAAQLLDWGMGKIERGSIAGLPEWYKDWLLTAQFEEKK